ncbi:unnamed protein product [Schistosoma rodhaini]|uniref:CSRNP_N domain-containing protein n=1 Tax=Schistosoma rodhaini TaxID=6188 RepID=A0A183R980_9TREM|nr:unnamed protein product [Schistosoma rodhaini]CAH8648436.1 unnamed protein product [Schistosoma rodhaini]
MRTTVESDCCLGSVIGVDKTAIPSNEHEILLNSQTGHESCSSVQSSSCCSTASHLTQEHPPNHSVCHISGEKAKCKDSVGKSIRFSGVTIYSFARQQGFSSIPDNGWCTLGMAQKHFSVSRLDLRQHKILQRLRRRQQKLLSQKCPFVPNISGRGRGKNKIKGRGKRANGLCSRSPGDSCRVPILSPPPPLSPQISYDKVNFVGHTDNTISSSHATPPPPCLSPPSPKRFLHTLDESLVDNSICNSLDFLDTDSEASLDHVPSVNSSKRTQNNSREKLMPLHSAARIRLLRSSGVVEIDESERLVCSYIRAMRSRVGCNCGPKNSCIPGQCPCADDGIPCQVDRASFPCSCAADGCRNPNGRNEFSREQVRTHTQHVLARWTSDYSDQPVKSPLYMSEAELSTPNGACSLCLDCSKTVTMSPNSPMFLSSNRYSELVQQLNLSLDNQFLSTPCTDVTHTKDYNIPPIDTTEENWSDHSPCSKPLKRSRLISNHNNSADNQVLQNSVVSSVSFSGSPLMIDLTLSPDEKSLNSSPKSTRDRNRLTNNEQTPFSKQSCPMSIPKVPHTQCASLDNNCITISDIPEAPRSCFTNEISNDDSLSDISVIINNNDINKDFQSVTKVIHRRRSRSADTTGSSNDDNFPMEMSNNHSKNVENILNHIFSLDSFGCDVTKSSSSVKQLSQVPNGFEYAKSNTCSAVTSIMNTNNKDCLLSKSAPNSPYLQKNDYPYGRISLRRRAIPRTPLITPLRRKVLTPSNHHIHKKQFNLLSTCNNKTKLSIHENLSTSISQLCDDDDDDNDNANSNNNNSDNNNNGNNNNDLITEIHSQPSSSGFSSTS